MLNKFYFDSIDDMILHNWRQCQKGEIIFSRREQPESEIKKKVRLWFSVLISIVSYPFVKREKIETFTYTDITDQEAWDRIYNSYIDEFGRGEDWQRIHDIQEEIALLQLDFVIENNNFLRNKIEALKDELNEILNRPIEGDMDSCLLYLGKWMGKGSLIDDKTITVKAFYKMLDKYNEEHERLKEAS